VTQSELVVLLMHRFAYFVPPDKRRQTDVIARRIAKKVFHRRKAVNMFERFKKRDNDRPDGVSPTYGMPVRNLSNYLRGEYK
jgi:hypothetical protein